MAAEPRTPQKGERLLLSSRLRVPRHVVYRSFPSETVVLNLDTGRYHGLNVTAAHMLEVLEAADTVRDAVGLLARDYEREVTAIREEVCRLCRALVQRGLVELDARDGA
jgi:hypothetical protein